VNGVENRRENRISPKSGNQTVIFRVTSYPKPDQAIRIIGGQGAKMKADTGGPQVADFFQPDGGMSGILFEQFKRLIR